MKKKVVDFQVVDLELWISKLWISSCGFRVVDFELWISSCGFRVVDFELWILSCGCGCGCGRTFCGCGRTSCGCGRTFCGRNVLWMWKNKLWMWMWMLELDVVPIDGDRSNLSQLKRNHPTRESSISNTLVALHLTVRYHRDSFGVESLTPPQELACRYFREGCQKAVA
jgi:hypothetical protein